MELENEKAVENLLASLLQKQKDKIETETGVEVKNLYVGLDNDVNFRANVFFEKESTLFVCYEELGLIKGSRSKYFQAPSVAKLIEQIKKEQEDE